MRFVILSSSRGTTFQAVIDAVNCGNLTATCLGLVSDKLNHGCVEKAEAANLPVRIIERRNNEPREEYDKRLHEAILELTGSNESRITNHEKTVVAAIGWLSIFSPWFIEKWKNRIINVHPALLPKYGGSGMYGMHVHEAVIASGDRESGITIHVMDEGVDTGPILVQKSCTVEPGDTVETLKTRIQALEKEWYPKVLQMIEEESLKLPSP